MKLNGSCRIALPLRQAPMLQGPPRALYRADGAHNLDLSAVKNFGIGEGRNLQVRGDFFNFTNSVQLGIPNANWNPNNLSGFGQVTSAASTPRQVQLGARFTF